MMNEQGVRELCEHGDDRTGPLRQVSLAAPTCSTSKGSPETRGAATPAAGKVLRAKVLRLPPA
jgi:hypothetical protein